MDQFLLYLGFFIVSFLFGWHMREYTAVKLIERREDEMRQYERTHILRTYIRYDNEMFYVYNSDNKAFLTQAKTKQQIIDFFKATYPEKRVIMDESDIELLEKHGV